MERFVLLFAFASAAFAAEITTQNGHVVVQLDKLANKTAVIADNNDGDKLQASNQIITMGMLETILQGAQTEIDALRSTNELQQQTLASYQSRIAALEALVAAQAGTIADLQSNKADKSTLLASPGVQQIVEGESGGCLRRQ
eukprot:TRINITY_DN7629_c0_g1_i2.p2 TRINITY_DN7629_c0_g1~~TRINITY_DN7629_c0_g1_i2.p2  ORF type:complete len:142 (+),score=39.94 TRINITY_DN7629_c0_g1_i2:207-632(+)